MIYRYTRTGDRHIRRGTLCDDAVAAVQYGDCAAMFLSDGCSSSLFGGDAARHITQRLAAMIRHPRIVSEKDDPITAGDMIRFFFFDSDINSAVVLTVGDGFVAANRRRRGGAVLISRGENIDHDPNRTYFCTSQNAAEHVCAYYVNNFDELLLSSDGIIHTVDIERPDELTRLMRQTSLAAGITDTGFSKGMDRMLTTFTCIDPDTRDLEDDCSAVYYSTGKNIRKKAKKTKH